MSNNFTIHNPTNANQESDAAFASDSLTTGGIGTDNIMPSQWMNARWYEDSLMGYCLAQMLSNKGYAVSKDDPNVLTAVLANILTNADQRAPLVTVAYSPTPTFDAAHASGFDITLAGNVTSSGLLNYYIGQILTFVIVQGSVPYNFTPPVGVNGWRDIRHDPYSVTVQQFIVRADQTIWPLVYVPKPVCNVQNLQGARFFNTTYQNVYDQAMTVSVSAAVGSSGGSMTASIGQTDASTPVVTQSRVPASNSNPIEAVGLTFVVPAGWYFSVGSFNLSMTLWTEWSFS